MSGRLVPTMELGPRASRHDREGHVSAERTAHDRLTGVFERRMIRATTLYSF